jgi:Trypsin-like peptidase domain
MDGRAEDAALQNMRNKVEPFLNAKAFFDTLEAARYQVCAIWVDDGKGSKTIRGTGFLVGPDLVLTARHVIDALIEEVAAGIGAGGMVDAKDGVAEGSHTRLACLFDYWTLLSKFDITNPPRGIQVVMAARDWLEWSSPRHPADGISHLFGPPPVTNHLDCAIIRLSRRVGATAHSGGKMRGWLPLADITPAMADGNIIAILQHPAGGPQAFDKGDFRDQDPSTTRIWYQTEATQGSSGSPCFDSAPSLVAFHNAGRPNGFNGRTADCNQGIRIDHVVKAMPPEKRGAAGFVVFRAWWIT